MRKIRFLAGFLLCTVMMFFICASSSVRAAESDYYFEKRFDDGGWFAVDGLRVTDYQEGWNRASGSIVGYLWTAEMVYGQPLTLRWSGVESEGLFLHMETYYFDSGTDISPYARFIPSNQSVTLPEGFPRDSNIKREEHYFDSHDAQGNLINGGEIQGTYTFTVPEQATQFRIRIHAMQGELFIYVTVTDAPGGITQEVTTEAEQTPGEDEGTDIIPEILNPKPHGQGDDQDGSGSRTAALEAGLSVAGALTAAGALSTAGGGKKEEGDSEEQKKRYRMYVYKAFGDAIMKGGQPVRVYARVSQIIDGKEYDCPEQTAKIRVSGENLSVRQAGIEGAYMAAEISAAAQTETEKGSVIFALSGPGGTVRRTVVFRIVEEPRIAFPRDTGDGHWDLNADESTVQMVAGEGGKERLRFVILDAIEEPKVIQFRDDEGFFIDLEKDPKLAFTYYALIDNQTDRIEKGADIFADKTDRHITIEAIFKDGLRINNYFTIELYPDGLSVIPNKDIVRNDRLIIETTENPNVKPGHSSIQPVYFDFTVCSVDSRTQKAVIRKNPSFSHEEPNDQGRYGVLFSYNFEYRIRHMGKVGVAFFPQRTLPTLAEPYEVSMRLIYDGEREHIEADLPMAVYGEKPARPSSAEWQKAYAWLQRDIRYFGIDNDPQLKALIRNAQDHSAAELEDIRKAVIEAGVYFCQTNGKAFEEFDVLCTRYLLVASSLVKAGDYALEFVMTEYFSGYGKIAAKFINPLKNLLAEYVGEYIASGNIDQAPDFVLTVLKSSEEALSAAITGVVFGDAALDQGMNTEIVGKTSMMRFKAPPISDEIRNILGYIIAVYLLTCFARHYNYGEKGEKGDVYRSVIASCADLGYESLKTWFLGFVTKQCTGLFEKIGKAGGDMCKKLCQGRIRDMAAASGKRAFGDSIRSSLPYDGRGLTQSSLDAARQARDLASAETKALQNEMLDNMKQSLGEAGKTFGAWLPDDVTTGQILNYMMGGDNDGTESLGTDTKEVIFNAVSRWLGVKAGNVYEGGGALNPMDVTMRVENGKIIIGMLGYYAEISILENIAALTDMLYQSLFSWMSGLLHAEKTVTGFDGTSDLRDQMGSSVEEIGRKLEEQKQRLENIRWQYTEYKNSTTGETVL